ncbi:hypothetical protein [Candidatus Uabimicrobium amorphum]|uniref:Uncharacterized protein n=1 Tax=Uabimicrobium amorphum TaxID=2596890 RepID=A0A5S9IKQ2_UABAM|nr:hypothetical protein [Candidatus Uabimicrobium amorphum]BBM83658.1 hypothetical protein UABAM_02011 [Candidatus Uabimicrobium amorphum]
MNEYLLLESETFRKKLCTDQNTCVLNEVGKLESFTENGWTTTEYIAKFYDVAVPTVKSVVLRNKNEVIMDGYKIIQKKDLRAPKFRKMFGTDIEKKIKPLHSKTRSIALFSRRAVLRIGMLLRDSEVAKKVRSYLLNSENRTLNNEQQHRRLLGQMAHQLTQQASQLAKNAEQLICQANLVTAAVNEIERTKEMVKRIDERVELQEQRLQALENSLRPNNKQQKISEEQVLLLKIELKKKKKHAVSVWSKFNKHFGLKSYANLPASSFDVALKWMKNYKG